MKAKKVMKIRNVPLFVTLRLLNLRALILLRNLINVRNVGKPFILTRNLVNIKGFI